MRLVVSGSIANDYLMTFPGRFSEHIVPEQLDRISLSFLIDALEIRRGGVAANICFGAGQLGLAPLLVGAVGKDFFAEYEPHLRSHGVDMSGLLVSERQHTAMFLCTSDSNENQIASFYPGAMSEASEIELSALPGDPPDLVVVCPNDPAAMQRHTREALEAGWPVAADPSQQLPRLDGDGVRSLVDGAAYLLSNDYESALIEAKSGWSTREMLHRVGSRVTTHGPKGCVIEALGEPTIEVAAVPPAPDAQLEPTGVGDAFRAGFIGALSHGLEPERCAQVGALMATLALETVGPQEYLVEPSTFVDRLARHYGDDAAADVSPLFSSPGAATDG